MAFGLASTASATTVSVSNPTTINIPDAGKASPYPSSIEVSGIVETVVDVNVTLSGLYHSYSDDLYFVLESPDGPDQTAVVLWNDAGGRTDLFNLGVLGNFIGLDPNGTWSLYAYDDATGDDGFLLNG